MLVAGNVSAVSECFGDCQYESPCAPVDICYWTLDSGDSLDLGLPLGSEDTASCGLSYNTVWELYTTATATCEFEGTVDGDILEEAMLYISINNDVVSCTLNGKEIFGSTQHEGCAPEDPRYGFSQDIFSEVIIDGTNTLVCEVDDRGVMTHFDACVVGDYEEPTCELIVDQPDGTYWFDSEAVPIEWHLTEGCTPIDWFKIWYQKDGNCNPDSGTWLYVPGAQDLASGEVEVSDLMYAYLWDKPSESGQYCVKVKVSSNGARGVSNQFNVDLAPPEVSLSVGSPQDGDCAEEATGDCYVNQDTELTLTCEDNNPEAVWQSGVDYIEYRINDGEWETYSGPFNFQEDSNHVLEYKCFDKVGKVDTESKAFIVDTVGPEFVSKTVGEPKLSGCDAIIGGESCDWYLTQNTEICLDYVDPQPHPVNEVEIYCETYWWLSDTEGEADDIFQIQLDEYGCFAYGQDSYHMLHCWAEDALGNRNELEDMYEADIVDSAAPDTTLSYTGPYYNNGYSQWIDTVSRVILTAVDPQPHPIEGVTTYFRYGVLGDSYCYEGGEYSEEDVDWEQDWMIYGEAFGLPESCHVIEYYSTDALLNTEVAQIEFVFSDHTAPTNVKVVGEPSSAVNNNPIWNWYENPNQNIEWEVTVDTPITISCDDIGNHPSGIKGIHYRIVWDGKYDDESAEWKFVGTSSFELKFQEQSEHLLEFYCEDNVGKMSEIDSELFKVTGEAFELTIGDKWDLISVPFNLIGNGAIEEVFDNPDLLEIWSYENGEWKVYSNDGPQTLTNIEPGRGYWVKTTDTVNVLIGGSLMQPATIPPSVDLYEGWNLIGHYGLSSKPAYCSLFSLVDTQQGFPRWSALWGYESSSQQFIPVSSWMNTNPGEGYWIEMDVADSYSPSSVCWGFQQIQN